ncbi:MAG: hypothetical protein K9H11_11530 [Rhodospirillum sp.]|nr:hypothetical protein [Rhodospirillum sp.]
MRLPITMRAHPFKPAPGVVALALALGLCPTLVQAQPLPESSLEGAIGECIGKEGATGDAVGDITIDLKTGRVVYRCDSDPKGKEKVLKSGDGDTGAEGESGRAKAQAGGAGETSSAGTPGAEAKGSAPAQAGGAVKPAASASGSKDPGSKQPAVDVPAADHGAAAAYVNTPRGPAPERPQDCVGAHPYYLTFPVCVMARKMGLLGDQTEAEAAAMTEGAPATGTPTGEEGAAPGAVDPAAIPASVKRTIGPLPDDAAEAAVRASEKVNASLAATPTGEGEGTGGGPMGSVSGGREDADWATIAFWIGTGLVGLLVGAVVVIGLLVFLKRSRMKHMGEPEDPYLAYFDDPEDLIPAEEDDDLGEDDGKGLFGGQDDEGDPLGAFDEGPMDGSVERQKKRKENNGTVDGGRAFTA